MAALVGTSAEKKNRAINANKAVTIQVAGYLKIARGSFCRSFSLQDNSISSDGVPPSEVNKLFRPVS